MKTLETARRIRRRHERTRLVATPPTVHYAQKHGLKAALREYEKRLILWALQESKGKKVHAAALLCVKPTTFHMMCVRLGVA